MICKLCVLKSLVGTFVRSAGRNARKSQSGRLRSECRRGDLTIKTKECLILDGVFGKVDESMECPVYIPVVYLSRKLTSTQCTRPRTDS
jgi:hypothetical protein